MGETSLSPAHNTIGRVSFLIKGVVDQMHLFLRSLGPSLFTRGTQLSGCVGISQGRLGSGPNFQLFIRLANSGDAMRDCVQLFSARTCQTIEAAESRMASPTTAGEMK